MNTQRKRTVIAVDDDEINLMILVKAAQEAGYAVKSFTSGEAAWECMEGDPTTVDIALVDKMMPGMNGIELLRRIKAHEGLRHVPVVIQTGDVGLTQMREGLENGAYYYLTKPFHPEILTAILYSAASECIMREELLAQMSANQAKFVSMLQDGEFTLKTHDEARLLSATLSQAAIYPEFAAIGLMELLSNAIEHGNLELGLEKKRKCLLMQNWMHEIQTRLMSAEYGKRVVRVQVERVPAGFHIVIRDEGKGFDWRSHMYEDGVPLMLHEPNGRGIAKAVIMLDNVHYSGSGNEAHCMITLPSSSRALPGEKGAALDLVFS